MKKYQDIRTDYTKGRLDENLLPKSPFTTFSQWFDEALAAEISDANAMVLSTVDAQGMPSSRVVLLKDVHPDGLIFYTNYNSQKGKEMAENPQVALNFFWSGLERQVRVQGKVEQGDPAWSENYFHSRPLESRWAAACSPQSEVLKNREALDKMWEKFKLEYPENPPRPRHWGAYLVRPSRFEFWQGGKHRLHDRVRYELKEGDWQKFRLAP